MRRLTFVLAACALLFAACDEQSPMLTEPEAAAAPLRGNVGAAPGGTYVLLTDGNAADLEAEVAGLGGTVTAAHAAAGVAVVSGLTEEGAAKLAGHAGVLDIQPDAVIPMNRPTPADPQPGETASASEPNKAILFSFQWNMRAIGADKAWAAGRVGSPGVTVAILDTGIDYTYPDLRNRVDLTRSTSFIPQEDAKVKELYPTRHGITDLDYHGTHVAATVSSNGLILAGVTSGTTLMGVKVCSALPEVAGCTVSAVLQGILYATDNGADVINLSIGGWFAKNERHGVLNAINKAFNYAHSKGVTVVAAAGNGHGDLQHNGNIEYTYCDSPHTICVSATGPTASVNWMVGPWTDVDAFAPYSNFGQSVVDVAAPGGTKYGEVWAGCSRTSLSYPGCRPAVTIINATGTSMAAPHVAGLAALLVEQHGRNPSAIRHAIEKSADPLGSGKNDPRFGNGRINVARALGL